MKFTCKTTKTLYAYNDDATQIALQEGDEVYLKLDLQHMDLFDKEGWIQKYPNGWVGGVIFNISPTGQKIKFKVEPCTYFLLRQKDIIAVSNKIPEEATK